MTAAAIHHPWSAGPISSGKASTRADFLSVALPRPADDCYALFSEIERTPEWLRILRSAVVTQRDQRRRATAVAFQASLERATIGYTCFYRYHASERRVYWSTANGASIKITGFAQFQSLTTEACMMTYGVDLDLGDQYLPAWADPVFARNAASATMNDFRDWVVNAYHRRAA
jgi:uncharacterized membrane protein